VNISSVVGRTTFPGFGIYGASKYAVEALSDALRAEVRPFGIDVVVVEPGFVRSEINSTEAASPDAVDGAYRDFTRATRRYVAEQVDGGADPGDLARLLVRVVETPRPRTRYLFPAGSRILVGTFARIPDRLADVLKLRAAGLRT
jgi:NAD(P)-dependent dehydrogenase (short-subunit alcohol dehydrogenase family)